MADRWCIVVLTGYPKVRVIPSLPKRGDTLDLRQGGS
jgi:hypothetical protein